jgi:predicted transcriptional regulator
VTLYPYMKHNKRIVFTTLVTSAYVTSNEEPEENLGETVAEINGATSPASQYMLNRAMAIV